MLVQNQTAADAQTLADLNRLTLAELRQYRRLEAKARGMADVIEIEAATPAPLADVAASSKLNPDRLKENDDG